MIILITGGAGFIGSHLSRALLDKGDEVICIDNFNDYYSPEIKEANVKGFRDNYTLYRADITDMKALKEIFSRHRIDKIVHLAARAGVRPSIEQPLLYEEVNIRGTMNLLECAREFKVQQFIFGSSSSVYGENRKTPFSEKDPVDFPISPYAATKKAGELLCYTYHKLYGIKITCLRFFTVYGPGGRPDMAIYKFTRLISEQKPIEMYGNGETKRDYTYISDIIDGIMAAVDKVFDYEIINLGDSNPVELRKLIELIEHNLKTKAQINRKPMQPGDVSITYADIERASNLLNYKPKIKIEEGIRKFVEWYKNG